ncbi:MULTISPECIES: flagellar basal body rod protein FlgB [Nesterenkonia]|uniref:flagellar basal body rod protein FlgB n=1 Tax=Nesterenkonia TaxID=57494 RepID=UPI0011B47687|nr:MULTISPECIES: flagellar basal body rod protein FlgB [Nesterenkonia]
MFDSVTSRALTSALDGLAARQNAIADNLANISTPNFHARRVQFESALADSVRRGDGAAEASAARSLEPTRLNGNNVNTDTETLSNADTVLRYQFAAQSLTSQFTNVRTALRSA